MSRVTELSLEELQEFEPFFKIVEQVLGFVPNDFLIMGRNPALLRAFSQLANVILAPGKLPEDLKWLIAHVTTRAQGCRYCQAHTGHVTTNTIGVSPEKVEASWEFETSPLFSEAERVALRLSLAAGCIPSAVTNEHFDEVRKYFNDDAIVEMVGIISTFGFLSRWNVTLAVDLEPKPLEFAKEHLAPHGWEPGAHVR
jgi:alkylhydroperoxidase family enzyme